MTEQNNIQEMTTTETPTQTPAPKREMFHALVRFKAPQEGMITVYAEDKFHARRILTSQFVNREGFEIVDVYAASEIKDTQEPASEDLADEVIVDDARDTVEAERITYGQ